MSVFASLAHYGVSDMNLDEFSHTADELPRNNNNDSTAVQASMTASPRSTGVHLPPEIWALVLRVCGAPETKLGVDSSGLSGSCSRTLGTMTNGLEPEDLWPLRRISRSFKLMAEREFWVRFSSTGTSVGASPTSAGSLRNTYTGSITVSPFSVPTFSVVPALSQLSRLPFTLAHLVESGNLRNPASLALVIGRVVALPVAGASSRQSEFDPDPVRNLDRTLVQDLQRCAVESIRAVCTVADRHARMWAEKKRLVQKKGERGKDTEEIGLRHRNKRRRVEYQPDEEESGVAPPPQNRTSYVGAIMAELATMYVLEAEPGPGGSLHAQLASKFQSPQHHHQCRKLRPSAVNFIARVMCDLARETDLCLPSPGSDSASTTSHSYPAFFHRLSTLICAAASHRTATSTNPLSKDLLLSSCEKVLAISVHRGLSLKLMVNGGLEKPAMVANAVRDVCVTASQEEFAGAAEMLTGMFRGMDVEGVSSVVEEVMLLEGSSMGIVGGLVGALFLARPTMTAHVLARLALARSQPKDFLSNIIPLTKLPRHLLPQLFQLLAAITQIAPHLPGTIERLHLPLADTLGILRNWPAEPHFGRELAAPRLKSGAWSLADLAEVLLVLAANNREADAAQCVVECEGLGAITKASRAVLHATYRQRAADVLGAMVLAEDALGALKFKEEVVRARMGLGGGAMRGDDVLRRVMFGGALSQAKFRWKDGGRARRGQIGVFEK
ncbi:hypothetical protein HDU93_006128 [Gonapodya sp. JEL0774]|nr:hypothetical protein HDU93_006128 [Gonapodya sp. JEL0774]